MAFASKVLYTGDGATKSFNIPMSYISVSHLMVYVDEILQLNPMNYTLSGASTIQFVVAPGDESAIEIKRNTSPSAILVDFQDGSVLNESDLDTAYLHTYYLSQEYADSFNEIINEALVSIATGSGITETETDAVIAALVNEMLNTDAAANLQARITDIDANAEAIITLGNGIQVQINTLAAGVAAAIYIQPGEPVPGVAGIPDPITDGARWYDSDDSNKPYIYILADLQWVSIEDPRIGQAVTDITVLEATVDNPTTGVVANTAAIVAEALVRATQDTAIAQTFSLLGAETDAGAAFLLDLNTVKVGASETLSSRFSSLSATDGTLQANITSEESARVAADGVIATTMSLIGAENGAKTAFILDEDTVKIASDTGDTVAERFTALTAADGVNSASITTIQNVTIPGVQTDLSDFETAVQAEYGVDLNVNGYVSGFRLINAGTPGASAFVILADKFAIVDPSGDPAEAEFVPFQIVSGKVRFNADVEIDGDLVVSGTINGSALIDGTLGSTQIGANAITTTQLNADSVTANKILANSVTAAKISVTNLAAVSAQMGVLSVDDALTMGTTGHMKGGQTAYNTGTGFFLGYDSSAYKFSIGDGSSNYMKWDGTTLSIKGDLVVGTYEVSDTAILSAITERTDSGAVGGYTTYKSFTIAKDGDIRLTVDYKHGAFSGGVITACNWQVTVNGVQDTTWSSSTQTTYVNKSIDLTGLSAGDVIDIDMIGGSRNPTEPLPVTAYVKNAYIKANVIIAPGGSVDLD